ncbi:MAG TPA: TspO/MBR family protein [Candidatus Saccharimonadales bacterium]|nr:TspO/MBR family protein [Candidatus Saccharimonadales bacterium]
MIKLTKFVASVLITFSAAAIGSVATSANIPTWYATLAKPFFSPPNWLFAPVWTILYLLMGLSLYLVWTAPYKKPKKLAFIIFGFQLALNVLWSLVFFGLQAPWAGVVVIILLLAAIIGNIYVFWPISKSAAYMLFPYVLWVSFATLLNIAVALLN